jgi:hypothetical protein
MPTFEDPTIDADEAREALRGLAHASQRITNPGETYRVLGSLSASLFSLQQSLDQLADWHQRNAERAATDHGDRRTGRRDALAASGHLRRAAGSARQAHSELRAAFNHNGQMPGNAVSTPTSPAWAAAVVSLAGSPRHRRLTLTAPRVKAPVRLAAERGGLVGVPDWQST